MDMGRREVVVSALQFACTDDISTNVSTAERYYSKEWLNVVLGRVSPRKDVELSEERNKCLRRYFPDVEERRLVNQEFARFSGGLDAFGSFDSLEDRWVLDPKAWWLVHGSSAPILQNLALKLLGQPCSSSCCERNWSTYSFMHSMRSPLCIQ